MTTSRKSAGASRADRSGRLNRRGWLAVGAAAAAAADRRARGDEESAGRDRGWIDAHVHVWTPDVKQYPLAAGYTVDGMQPPSFTPRQLMGHARPTGVRRVVLIQMSFYGFDNSYMLDVIRDHPGVYAGVAVIDENDDPAAVMRKLKPRGVAGCRIRPSKGAAPDKWLDSDGMRAMWNCGAAENIAMCHLIDPEYMASVDRMCRENPDTPAVIDHFARIGIDGKIRSRDVRQLAALARHKNLKVKISAYYALGKKQAPYKDLIPMIRRLIDAYGVERLMWASDCPFQVVDGHRYAPSIDLIKNLDGLSDTERDWLLRRTAAETFFAS